MALSSSSLYEQLGPDLIEKVVTEFYIRAFADPFIGHFFFKHDREHLTKQQTDFAINLLGGPRRYAGKALPEAHKPLSIRPAHFGRRQVLMREVLADLGVAPELAKAWLELEERLKPLIVKDAGHCLG